MKKSDAVGYRKPPKNTQFKKGKSGNPNGRPKGAKNFSTDLIEVLEQLIVIREGGRVKKVTGQRALLLRMLDKGLKGDPRAAMAVLGLAERRATERPDEGAARPLSAEEIELLEAVKSQLLPGTDAPSDTDGPPDDEEEKS